MHSTFFNFPRYDIIESAGNVVVEEEWSSDGKTLVIVSMDYEVEEYKKLLVKILEAINCNQNNTTLIQLNNNEGIKLTSIQYYNNAESIISLGFTPLDLGLNIEYSIFQTKMIIGKKFLFCPSLEQIDKNIDYKKELWGELKSEFI